jgi:cytosine/adenosine deaminase-related metal-dependent hydrolase
VILKAAWVLPIVGPPIRDGVVRVDGQRIAEVGSVATLPPGGEAVTDLGAAVLLPGLINAHTHLELTCYAGRFGPAPFWDWLRRLAALRAARGQVEREQQGVCDGAWQSLQAGVTCVGDISRRSLNWQVLKSIPIRKVCYIELLSLADDPPRDPAELRAAVEEVEEDELLTAGITPHAPYTVPAAQIQAALAIAAERKRPWCTHWAETREERAFLLGDDRALPGYLRDLLAQCQLRSPGLSAIDLLERCAEGVHAGALAHFNYAQPGDAERLAAAGHTVVYCPRAHRFFGHPPHPYRELMNTGVAVAVGTDSVASNDSLAVLEELRFMHRELPDPPRAEALLEMVTTRAARALGLHEQVGSLEPGKLADLAAFPCPPDSVDPASELVSRAPAPVGVWVAGRPIIAGDIP